MDNQRGVIVIDMTNERTVLHWDRRDDNVPACGANPEGAYLVDHLPLVTCPGCAAASNYPLPRMMPGGAA